MLLEEESFSMIKQHFQINNDVLELKDFVVAIMENFKDIQCKVGLVKMLIDLFHDIDIDANGVLEFKEFLQYLIDFQKKTQGSEEITKSAFQRIFDIYSKGSNDSNRFILTSSHLPMVNFFASKFTFWTQASSFYMLIWVAKLKKFHLFANKLATPRSIKWEAISPASKSSETGDPFVGFCHMKERPIILVLMKSEVIVFDLSTMKSEHVFRISAKSPEKIISLCKDHFVIFHGGKHLTFYCLKGEELEVINRLSIAKSTLQHFHAFSFRSLAFSDDKGSFYVAKECPVKRVYLVRTSFIPMSGHLIKGFYVLEKVDQVLFWGFSNDFVMFYSTEWVSNSKRICLHNNEIQKVEFFASRSTFISVDVKGVVILWSLNNFIKSQTFSLNSSVNSISILEDQSKILFFTKNGAMFAEGLMLKTYFAHLKILSFTYINSIRKFLLITNRDIRLIDTITGEVTSLIANLDHNIKESIKCVEPSLNFSKTPKPGVAEQGMDPNFLILLTEYDNSASLFSLKNYQKLSKVISKRSVQEGDKDEQIEIVSIVKFLPFFDCFAVGYSNSFVKLFKNGLKNNPWSKKLSGGHEESKLTALDSFEHTIVTGSKNGRLAVWNITSNFFYKIRGNQSSSIKAVAFLSGKAFVSVAKYENPIVYRLRSDNFFGASEVIRIPSLSLDSFLTFGLDVQIKGGCVLKLANSKGSVMFFQFSDSREGEEVSDKGTLNYKMQETYICQKERSEISHDLEVISAQSSDTLSVLREKIFKMSHEYKLDLTFAIGRKNVGIFTIDSVVGRIGIQESPEKLWNIQFDWVSWEMEDLEKAISTIEVINDRKLSSPQKNQMRLDYFSRYYGDWKSGFSLRNTITDTSIPSKLNQLLSFQSPKDAGPPIVTLTMPNSANNKNTHKLIGIQSNTLNHTLSFANFEPVDIAKSPKNSFVRSRKGTEASESVVRAPPSRAESVAKSKMQQKLFKINQNFKSARSNSPLLSSGIENQFSLLSLIAKKDKLKKIFRPQADPGNKFSSSFFFRPITRTSEERTTADQQAGEDSDNPRGEFEKNWSIVVSSVTTKDTNFNFFKSPLENHSETVMANLGSQRYRGQSKPKDDSIDPKEDLLKIPEVVKKSQLLVLKNKPKSKFFVESPQSILQTSISEGKRSFSMSRFIKTQSGFLKKGNFSKNLRIEI